MLQNLVSLFSDTPYSTGYILLPITQEPRHQLLRPCLFTLLLTNPFTKQRIHRDSTTPDSLCYRFVGYLLLLMEF